MKNQFPKVQLGYVGGDKFRTKLYCDPSEAEHDLAIFKAKGVPVAVYNLEMDELEIHGATFDEFLEHFVCKGGEYFCDGGIVDVFCDVIQRAAVINGSITINGHHYLMSRRWEEKCPDVLVVHLFIDPKTEYVEYDHSTQQHLLELVYI